METVPGVGIADDVAIRGCLGQRFPKALHVRDRDGRIQITEQAEPRGRHRRGLVDEGRELREPARDNATAVKPDTGPEDPAGGDQEAHSPTHAETDDAYRYVTDPDAAEVVGYAVQIPGLTVLALGQHT